VTKSQEVAEVIYAEQVKLSFAALPGAITVTLLLSTVLAFVEWSVMEHRYVALWLGAMFCVQLARAVLYISYMRHYDGRNTLLWGRLFVGGVIAAGLIWASSILFLFPAQIEYQVFLAFVIAGVSAGAVTSLSYLRTAIMVFLPILLLPLVVRLFLEGGSLGLAMGIMVTAFLVMISSMANSMYNNYRQNLAMKHEALFMESALQESESKYRHIFESVPLGIAYYSGTGVVLDHNPVCCKIFAMSDDELRNWNVLQDGDDPEFHDAVRVSLQQQFVQYEGLASAMGGDKGTAIRVFLAAIENEHKHEGVAIIQDITEDKALEKAKEEFISSVSHELRTPLTSIQAVLGLIEGEQVGEVSEQMQPLIDIASRNSNRLASLINDILDLGKMNSGDIQVKRANVQVMPLIEDAMAVMQPYAEQCQVRLRLSSAVAETCINVDEKRFSQVLSNLISNASKFSPEKSEVVIQVQADDNKVRIEVIDSGPGIPDEFQVKIFDKFTQYDSSDTRTVNGSGLGLNISQMLVQRMDGEIGFETVLNKGTTFYIDFPVVEC